MWILAGLIACNPADTDVIDVLPPVDGLTVDVEPDPPVAGAPATLSIRVLRDGAPLPLVEAHEALVHASIVGPDLEREHLHPTAPADPVAPSYPVAWTPTGAGLHRLFFEYADEADYFTAEADLDVVGEPEAPAPDLTPTDTVTVDGVRLTLIGAPTAGTTVDLEVRAEVDGVGVTDLVPWHGSDGHLFWTSADRRVAGHAHAYIPGFEDLPPGAMEPHRYPGPGVPFRTAFPDPGTYVVWTEIARASGAPIVGRFVIRVV